MQHPSEEVSRFTLALEALQEEKASRDQGKQPARRGLTGKKQSEGRKWDRDGDPQVRLGLQTIQLPHQLGMLAEHHGSHQRQLADDVTGPGRVIDPPLTGRQGDVEESAHDPLNPDVDGRGQAPPADDGGMGPRFPVEGLPWRDQPAHQLDHLLHRRPDQVGGHARNRRDAQNREAVAQFEERPERGAGVGPGRKIRVQCQEEEGQP